MSGKLLIRQCRAEIGRPQHQRLVLRGLGLRGPGSSVVINNERAMRGMVRKVLHLVEVSSVEGADEAATAARGRKS